MSIEDMQRATRDLGLAINMQLLGRRQSDDAERELRQMLRDAYSKRAEIQTAIAAAEAVLPRMDATSGPLPDAKPASETKQG